MSAAPSCGHDRLGAWSNGSRAGRRASKVKVTEARLLPRKLGYPCPRSSWAHDSRAGPLPLRRGLRAVTAGTSGGSRSMTEIHSPASPTNTIRQARSRGPDLFVRDLSSEGNPRGMTRVVPFTPDTTMTTQHAPSLRKPIRFVPLPEPAPAQVLPALGSCRRRVFTQRWTAPGQLTLLALLQSRPETEVA